jgi:hypothetical protein
MTSNFVKGLFFAWDFNSDYPQARPDGGEILKMITTCVQRKTRKAALLEEKGFTKLAIIKLGQKIHLHPVWNG